jgi:hypothetical protein
VTTHHAIFIIEEYYITAKINTVLVKEPRISMAKCLSLRQPYAKLIVRAGKTIELRKWNTKFSGEFLIYASILAWFHRLIVRQLHL